MKNFIKQNWFKLILILFLILAFCWYEVRSSIIRSNCYDKVVEKSKEKEKRVLKEWNELYNIVYKSCLSKNGLKE